MIASHRKILGTICCGFALIAIVAVTVCGSVWANYSTVYPSYHETAGDAQKRLASPSGARAGATKDVRPCHNSDGYDGSYLCSQWRASDATERTSRWTWLQMVFSFFGIVGLGITVWFNQQAWKSAQSSRSDTTQALKESERSANAMSDVAEALTKQLQLVAETTKTNREIADRQKLVAELQLRAYLSVVTSGGVYQEREKGKPFRAISRLINSGQTPARNVRHRMRVDVLPVPLPENHVLPDPPEALGDGFLPPHQDRSLNAVLDRFIDDELVEKVKRNDGLALYAWGIVTYTDAFNEAQKTEFCHQMSWIYSDKGEFMRLDGFYTPGRNSAT